MMGEPLHTRYELLKAKLRDDRQKAAEIRESRQKEVKEMRNEKRKVQYAARRQLTITTTEQAKSNSQAHIDDSKRTAKSATQSRQRKAKCSSADVRHMDSGRLNLSLDQRRSVTKRSANATGNAMSSKQASSKGNMVTVNPAVRTPAKQRNSDSSEKNRKGVGSTRSTLSQVQGRPAAKRTAKPAAENIVKHITFTLLYSMAYVQSIL